MLLVNWLDRKHWRQWHIKKWIVIELLQDQNHLDLPQNTEAERLEALKLLKLKTSMKVRK